ncbi:MAG: transcriptional regulator MraZ, partial [Pseudonocardiales bacterium]|nr:transcriptional regulator MraZ [Pseudonocardiales bacterium]
MFLGTHTPRLDDKGRLALPARFRAELEGGLVICKGQDRCLFIFGVAEFERFTESLRNAPVTDRRVRDYGRVLFASASHETPDGQGRITVPAPLRVYAGLTKDCAV